MKRFFLLVIGVFSLLKISGQTFYEVRFTEPKHHEEYLGLFIYYNEDSCKARFVTKKLLREDEVIESNYYNRTEYDSKEKMWSMVYLSEDMDEYEIPLFYWQWKKKDASDMNESPWMTFDLDDDDDDSFFQADYFVEKPLRDMTEEYLDMFYGDLEPEYKLVMEGRRKLLKQGVVEVDKEDRGRWSQSDNRKTSGDEWVADKSRTATVTTTTIEPVVSEPQLDATFHLIVVANTEVSDIGQACKVDLANVKSEFKGVAKALNMTYDEQLVSGEKYGKQELSDVVRKMSVGTNDVILFVYTGHGFRFADQKDQYPNMDLSATSYDDITKNYVAVSDVYRELSQKGARLCLVFSDCCNSEISLNRPVLASNSLYSRSNNSYDKDKLKSLFVDSKGSLVATAAKPGEYSWCGTNGGFFLMSLLESMRNQISVISTVTPSWNTLVSDAISSALKKSTSGSESKAQNGIKFVNVK